MRYRLPAVVAPYTGAWIEIVLRPVGWGRVGVAPYTGAWIEICFFVISERDIIVAPYTGAWIEIVSFNGTISAFVSLPTRERGLKSLVW